MSTAAESGSGNAAPPIIVMNAKSGFGSEIGAAWQDLVQSFKESRIWAALAMNDIRGRYRGSLLGPFWITLTTAAFVGGIGLLYAGIMRVPLEQYLPYLTTGVVIWNMIASGITESGDTFPIASGILKQTSISPLVFVWRTILRVIINFLHEVVVILVVLGIFHYLPHTRFLDLPLGFAVIILNLAWLSCLVAIISARYRDVPQIVRAIVQFLFFLSPVIWLPGAGRAAASVVKYNPVSYMLDVTRTPLLGGAPHPQSYLILVLLALFGGLFTFFVYASVRRRIVHYI